MKAEEEQKKQEEEEAREAMFLQNLQNNFHPSEPRKDTIRNRDTITARRMTRKTFR